MGLFLKNDSADPEAARLVREAWAMVPLHWRRLSPVLEVTVVANTFDKVSDLREWAGLMEEHSRTENVELVWERCQIAWLVLPHAIALYVRLDRESPLNDPAYFFKKRLFAALAGFVWLENPKLRKHCASWVAGPAARDPEMVYLIFQESFSRVFLNPGWLRTRRETGWNLIKRVDRFVARVA